MRADSEQIDLMANARVGTTIKGKWHLDRLIGVGGMAAVYAATHRNRKRAALKILHPEFSRNDSIRERFLREGYVANTVGHAGVIRVDDDDVTEDGSVFLVMELVEGETLDQRLTHTPALLLSGDVSAISENFNVSHQQAGEVIDFTLTPKAKDTLFDTLRLSFRGDIINDMQMVDGVGQRTNILFQGVRLNEPLKADLFTFEIPEGTDVISE